jgi:hypothetical protein
VGTPAQLISFSPVNPIAPPLAVEAVPLEPLLVEATLVDEVDVPRDVDDVPLDVDDVPLDVDDVSLDVDDMPLEEDTVRDAPVVPPSS